VPSWKYPEDIPKEVSAPIFNIFKILVTVKVFRAGYSKMKDSLNICVMESSQAYYLASL